MQIERKNRGPWSGVSGQLKSVAAASRGSDLQPSSFRLPPSFPPRRSRRLAFTLTELLVVIAIIAVLAAMVSVGVMRALDTAKQTRIKTEVDQLDAAFKSYREKYGSFPPSHLMQLSGSQQLKQHLARAFPRYDMSNLTQVDNELTAAGLDANSLRPDHALVFWLKGFSPDPAHPFVTVDGYQIMNGAATTTKVQVTPLFDFDKTRLVAVPSSSTRIPSYFPQGTKADPTGAPYIYWDSGSRPMGEPSGPRLPLPLNTQPASMWNHATGPGGIIFSNAGAIRPYAFDADGNGSLDIDGDGVMDAGDGWANPDSFQIISAGMDGKYGSLSAALTDHARIYPTGIPALGATDPSVTTYDVAGGDDDNVTNFSSKARLGDAKP